MFKGWHIKNQPNILPYLYEKYLLLIYYKNIHTHVYI